MFVRLSIISALACLVAFSKPSMATEVFDDELSHPQFSRTSTVKVQGEKRPRPQKEIDDLNERKELADEMTAMVERHIHFDEETQIRSFTNPFVKKASADKHAFEYTRAVAHPLSENWRDSTGVLEVKTPAMAEFSEVREKRAKKAVKKSAISQIKEAQKNLELAAANGDRRAYSLAKRTKYKDEAATKKSTNNMTAGRLYRKSASALELFCSDMEHDHSLSRGVDEEDENETRKADMARYLSIVHRGYLESMNEAALCYLAEARANIASHVNLFNTMPYMQSSDRFITGSVHFFRSVQTLIDHKGYSESIDLLKSYKDMLEKHMNASSPGKHGDECIDDDDSDCSDGSDDEDPAADDGDEPMPDADKQDAEAMVVSDDDDDDEDDSDSSEQTGTPDRGGCLDCHEFKGLVDVKIALVQELMEMIV
jgi:hypothetical protein